MYGRKFINGSVEWLGVPTFLRNDGLPGLTISCVPVCVVESEVRMKFGLWRVNLAVITEVLTSRGVEPYLLSTE